MNNHVVVISAFARFDIILVDSLKKKFINIAFSGKMRIDPTQGGVCKFTLP